MNLIEQSAGARFKVSSEFTLCRTSKNFDNSVSRYLACRTTYLAFRSYKIDAEMGTFLAVELKLSAKISLNTLALQH